MVGRRGEARLVPPYSFRRPNKAMALRYRHTPLKACWRSALLPPREIQMTHDWFCNSFPDGGVTPMPVITT